MAFYSKPWPISDLGEGGSAFLNRGQGWSSPELRRSFLPSVRDTPGCRSERNAAVAPANIALNRGIRGGGFPPHSTHCSLLRLSPSRKSSESSREGPTVSNPCGLPPLAISPVAFHGCQLIRSPPKGSCKGRDPSPHGRPTGAAAAFHQAGGHSRKPIRWLAPVSGQVP